MHKSFGCCCPVVFDFFNGKVGVCGDSLGGVDRVDVDDDEDRVWDVIPEESVDGEIGAAEFGTRVVPSDDFFTGYTQNSHPIRVSTIDLFEHVVHVLNVSVVQEPYIRVFVIFFKWHCSSERAHRMGHYTSKGIGDVDG
jgi:hypothetical protein